MMRAILAAMTALFLMGPSAAHQHESDGHGKAGTIVEVAAANPDFSTLVAAIKAAGLVETLSSPGPFTVFAPTNEAFARLPKDTLDALLMPENKYRLIEILTHHVVPGKVLSPDLAGKTLKADTVEGTPLSIDGTEGVRVDGIPVIIADIEASNGVIHVVGSVLMP